MVVVVTRSSLPCEVVPPEVALVEEQMGEMG